MYVTLSLSLAPTPPPRSPPPPSQSFSWIHWIIDACHQLPPHTPRSLCHIKKAPPLWFKTPKTYIAYKDCYSVCLRNRLEFTGKTHTDWCQKIWFLMLVFNYSFSLVKIKTNSKAADIENECPGRSREVGIPAHLGWNNDRQTDRQINQLTNQQTNKKGNSEVIVPKT